MNEKLFYWSVALFIIGLVLMICGIFFGMIPLGIGLIFEFLALSFVQKDGAHREVKKAKIMQILTSLSILLGIIFVVVIIILKVTMS